MTQFVDNENLSKNTLLEIDMVDMTRSHLTGAHQSCGLSVLSLPSTVCEMMTSLVVHIERLTQCVCVWGQ